MTDIDTPIPDDYEYSHTIPAKAVLKEGITKKKGDPIYANEIDSWIPQTIVYKKKDGY